MKIINIFALMMLLATGVFFSVSGQDGRDSYNGIELAQEMFPRSIQDEMDAVLGEYDTISQELAKTVDQEERAELSAQLEVLQKNIGSLSDVLAKQAARDIQQDQDLDSREEDTEEDIEEKQEVPEVKEEAEAEEQKPKQEEFTDRTKEIRLHLAMVEKGFDWISTTLFDRHLLGDQQNLQLDICMHVITTQIDGIKKHVQDIDNLESLGSLAHLFEPYKKQIEILQYFVNLQKNVAVRYDIFMIGHNDTPQALMKEPLSRAEYQKALCAIFVQLSEVFNELFAIADQISLHDIEIYVNEQAVLTNLVREQLPAELQLGYLTTVKRKLGLTDQARRFALAYTCVGIDLDQTYPELFTLYLDIITQFNNHNHASYKLLSSEFMTDLESLLMLCAQRVTALKYGAHAHKKVCLLLELMMTRLLKIKSIVMQARAWNFDMTNDQDSAELLIGYKLLTKNNEYQVLFAHKPFSDVHDLLKTVIERYFENKATTESFLYDLYVLKYKLIELKDVLGSKQEYVPKSWTKWLWEKASNSHYHPMRTYLDRMLGFVHKTIELTTPADSVNNTAKKESGIIDQILSGQWWSTGTAKSNVKSIHKDINGKVVLELVDDLQKQQFNDFKSAAFHTLSRVSPLLMVGLMKYLLPYVSQELGSKIMNFVTDHEQAKNKLGNLDSNRDNHKVTDFIMDNPAIYEEFSRKHPDVIESLGRQAADKMRA